MLRASGRAFVFTYAMSETSSPMRSVVGSSGDWQELQKRTFTAWSNVMLSLIKDKHLEIKDLANDFKDGLLLSYLIQAASGTPSIKRNEPQSGKELIKTKAIENINAALDVALADGVKLTNIGANDIYTCNEKLINGLIWSLILKYQIGQSGAGGGAKKMLLEWVNEILPGQKVGDFKKSWSDGKLLAQLINGLLPNAISQEDIDSLPPVPLTRRSQEVARDQMDVPIIVPAEDLVECADDNIQMMMLSYFRNWHSEKTGKDSPSVQRRRKNSTPVPPVVLTTPVKVEPIPEIPTPRDNEIEDLKRERDEISSEAQSLRTSMANLEVAKQETSNEIEKLKKMLEEKTKEADSLDRSNSEKAVTIGDQSKDLSEKKEQLEAVSKEKEELVKEVEELKAQLDAAKLSNDDSANKSGEQVADLQKRLAAASSENEKLKKQAEASLVEHDALIVSSSANEERVSYLQEELKEKNEMIDKLVNRDIAQLRSSVKAKEDEARQLRDKLKSIAGDFKQELTTLVKQRDDTMAELDKLKGKVSAYSKQLVDLQEQVAHSTSGNLEQLESELQKMQLKNEEMQSSINKLEAEMLEATKKAEALMAMLSEANLLGFDDDFNSNASDSASAAPTAIAGDGSEAVVERYEADPKLKDRLAAAESQVLSMLRFRAEKEAQIAELVKQNEENVELLQVLDRKIKLGQNEKGKLSDEVTALNEQIGDLKKQLEEAKAATNTCENNRSELNDQIEELKKQLSEEKGKTNTCETDRSGLNDKIKNMEQTEKELQNSLNDAKSDLDKSKADLEAAQKLIEELKQRIASSAGGQDALNTQLDGVTKERDDLQKQLEEARAALGKTEKDLEKVQTELGEAKHKVEEKDRDIAEKQKLFDDKSEECDKKQTEVDDREKALKQKMDELSEKLEELAENAQLLSDANNAILEKDDDISKQKEDISKKEDEILKKQQRIKELEAQLAEVQKKMPEAAQAALDMASKDMALHQKEQELKSKEKDLEEKKQEISGLKDEISGLKGENSKLQSEMDELKTDLDDKNDMLKDSLASLDEKSKSSADLQKKTKELSDRENDIVNLKEQISKLNAELQASKDSYKEMEPKMKELAKASKLAEERGKALEASQKDADALRIARAELEKLKKEKDDLHKDLSSSKATNDKDSGEIAMLTKRLQERESELKKLKSEFQDAMANLSDKLAAAETAARESQKSYKDETSAGSTFLKYIVPLGLVVVALGAGRLLGGSGGQNSS